MDNKTRIAVAENIQRLRKEMGWNQTRLAAKAGVAQTVISYIEKPLGKSPTLDTLAAIAGAFGVPVWTLLVPHASLPPPILKRMDELVHIYASLPAEGQVQVERIAEAESRYATTHQ